MTGDKDFQHEFHDIDVRLDFNMINQSCNILKDFARHIRHSYHTSYCNSYKSCYQNGTSHHFSPPLSSTKREWDLKHIIYHTKILSLIIHHSSILSLIIQRFYHSKLSMLKYLRRVYLKGKFCIHPYYQISSFYK